MDQDLIMGYIRIRNAGVWKTPVNMYVRRLGVWVQAVDLWFRYNQNWVRLTPFLQPGDPFGGGYFVAKFSDNETGSATHNIIVADKIVGQSPSTLAWKTTATNTNNTINAGWGKPNNDAMAGGAHPARDFCVGLSINGFSDWYMPTYAELELCYYNLKPTTTNNITGGSGNQWSVPKRIGGYTISDPAQTASTLFQSGQQQAFNTDNFYWTSYQTSNTNGWVISFNAGSSTTRIKTDAYYVRAVRRVPV